METVEVIVYIAIALIAGMLMLSFIRTTDFSRIKLWPDKDAEPEFRKVDIEGFVSDAVVFWKECGLGEKDSTLRLHVSGQSQLDKSAFFSYIKKANLCSTLESAEEECGMRETVEFNSTINLPGVVRLTCNSSTQKLVIVG
jgi:hypothetical protein